MASAPFVDKLLLSGDIEINPGPVIEDILKELRSFRSDTANQFEAMRVGMGTLKTDILAIREDVCKTQEQLGEFGDEMNDVMDTIDLQYGDLNTLHEHAWVVQEKIDRLEETIEKQDRYSRRNNVIFYGVIENKEEYVIDVVLSLLNEHIRKKTWSPGDFVRIHRLGRRWGKRPRPIIVCLLSHQDKFLIINTRSKLRENGIGVSNDYTQAQRNALQMLKDNGKKGYYKGDTLYIGGKPYDKESERDQTRDCNTFYLKVNPDETPLEIETSGKYPKFHVEGNRLFRNSVTESEQSGSPKFHVEGKRLFMNSVTESEQSGRVFMNSVTESEQSGSCSKVDLRNESPRRPTSLALDLACDKSTLKNEACSITPPADHTQLSVGDSPSRRPSTTISDQSNEQTTIDVQANSNQIRSAPAFDPDNSNKANEESNLLPRLPEQSVHKSNVSVVGDTQRISYRRRRDNDSTDKNVLHRKNRQSDDDQGSRRKSKGYMHHIHKLFSSTPRKPPDMTIRH